jgi:glutamate/tyrosine decarboxylase-like PLP-dependent enzyme
MPPTQNGSQTPDTAQIEDILQMAAQMVHIQPSFVTSYLIGQSFCVSIGLLFMKWSFLIGSFSSILIGG